MCRIILKGVHIISNRFLGWREKLSNLVWTWYWRYMADVKVKNMNKNKKNDKRFNNHSYSLFSLRGIFLKYLKYLWLIRDILKWQKCKIFTNLAPSQNPSRRSHRKCSVKRDIPKKLQNLSGNHLRWSMF